MSAAGGLQIAEGLSLPPEATTETFAILAKRGMGKTYTAAVLAEEMLKAGRQVVIVDPVGVWWGLRSSATGDGPGLPIAILGGDHADAPLPVTCGELVADLVVDERLSCVLDLSLLRKAETVRFLTEFAETLYRRNRQALHLILDEADVAAPQRAMPGEQRLLGAIEDLVRRGRARGIGITLITQRPAVLNKNVLTQIEVLIALRLIAPQDRAAVDDWIKVHGTEEQRQEYLTSLPHLQVGEAWVWSPAWLDLFQRVQIRRRETFDSSRTPEVGAPRPEPKVLAPLDFTSLRERLAVDAEEEASDTTADAPALKHRISELERQIAARPAPAVQRVEVPVLSEEQIASLREVAEAIRVQAEAAASAAASILGALDRLPTRQPEEPPKPIVLEPRETERTRVKAAESSGETGPARLRDGERRMLAAVAQLRLRPLTRTQLGSLAGFAPSGGTFGTYLSVLKRSGLLTESGGALSITHAGIKYLGSACPPALTTTAEAQSLWRATLRSGERKMLDVLIRAHPGRITRKDLARQTGFAADGGPFGTYLSVLRRNGLATVSGEWISAGEALFIKAAAAAERG